MSTKATFDARALAIAIAVVLPLLIVAAGLAGLESYRTYADKRESRNAGKVINGRVVEGGVELVMENKLQYEPEIVILGNSLSNTDLQSALLARRLGLPRTRVQKFSIPNSMGAHWYVVLKNRVYAGAHTPKLVILLSDLQSLLALAPRSEASYLNLSVHFTEREPVIDQLLGTRNFYLERVRENRGKMREKALTTARNAIVDLLFRQVAPTSKNDRKTESALTRVFDDSRTDMRLHNNVIPIFNNKSSRDLMPFDPKELPDPEGSFIPHIAEMVRQNGGHLVILRPPMSPMLPQELGDVVLPETEARVAAVLARYGATYLDLRTIQAADEDGEVLAKRFMDQTHYENIDHMNHEGGRRFTEIVADLVDDLAIVRRVRPSAELLRTKMMVDGAFTEVPLRVEFKDPPPKVPRPERAFVQGRNALVYFPTIDFGFLNDLSTVDISPHASRCSPLRVLEDGEALPMPNVSCEEVTRFLRGRTCHTPEKVFFTTPDRSDPFDNGRRYRLALDVERRCDGALWLYPGDRTVLTVRPADAAALQRGAGAIRMSGTALGEPGPDGTATPAIRVRVRGAAQIRLDETVPLDALPGRGAVLALTPRIGPRPNNAAVELINESDQFVLLSSVRLMADVPRTVEELEVVVPEAPEPVAEGDDAAPDDPGAVDTGTQAP